MMALLRVLVVEDDAIISELFGDLLELMGHEVCASVATEGDAIRAAERLKPGLMIVDELLGKGSGSAAMTVILNVRHVPHLFVTTSVSRVRATHSDAIIVQKPFRETDLADGIERALNATPHYVGSQPVH